MPAMLPFVATPPLPVVAPDGPPLVPLAPPAPEVVPSAADDGSDPQPQSTRVAPRSARRVRRMAHTSRIQRHPGLASWQAPWGLHGRPRGCMLDTAAAATCTGSSDAFHTGTRV